MSGGREPGHVKVDLGEDELGGTWADAGDLVQPLEHGGASSGAAGVMAVRFGNLRDGLGRRRSEASRRSVVFGDN